jgi:hypothetical protein
MTISIKILAVACVFAVADAGVSRLVALPIKSWNVHVGVVFALVGYLLFWRSRRIVLVAPLVVLIWIAAFYSTFVITAENAPGLTKTLVSVLVGGAVGGAGLGICESIYSKRMAPGGLVVSTLIGCVAALPFWAWNTIYISNLDYSNKSQERILLTIAFAVWWAVMGAYLYASSCSLFPKSPLVIATERSGS